MKYLIFALIFLLLVGAIVAAVVFLRKKQADNANTGKPFTPMPPVNKPQSPQVNHQADEPIPTLSPTPTPAQPNYLQKAQQLIDHQRFDEAEQELKRGLTAKPNDGELTIKLLNLYAMNHQHGDFNALYEKIRTQGDTSTLNQANRLKSLVDAEQAAKVQTTATSSATVAGQTEIIPDEGLDFDLSLDEPDSDDSDDGLDLIDFGDDLSSDSETDSDSKESNEDDILSFDDLENQLLDKPTTETKVENQTSPANNDDALELTLDGLEGIDEEDKQELTELEPSLSINNDSLELEDSNHAKAQEDTLSLDDDAFSLDIADTDNKTHTNEQSSELNELGLTESQSTNIQPDTDDELAFDWGLEDDSSTKPTSESTQTDKQSSSNELSLDDEQLDWGLEEDKTATTDDTFEDTPKQPEPTSTTPVISEDDDGFALNIDDSESVASIEQDGEFNFEDLDLSSDSNDDKEAIADLEQDLNQGFDFDIDDTNTADSLSDTTKAQAEPEVSKDTDELSLSNFDDFDAIEVDALSLDDDKEADTTHQTPVVDKTSTTQSVEEDKVLPQADSTSDEQTLGGGVEDTLAQLDALNFDDIYSTDTPTKDDNISDTAPVAKETPVQDSSSTSDVFSGDFGFVNNLDGAQVTLELAVQYLDLGEYESAKRLLNEVIQHGDSQQQDLAKELLAKAG